MYNNSHGNLTQARQQAQANATHFQTPYTIYTDTNGSIRVCRQDQAPQNTIETIYPPHKTA